MGKVAFVFPGQGAQKTGMAADFYENHAGAREIFDGASRRTGLDIAKLCFTENDRLDRTEYTQVCLLVACLAMERAVREEGIRPDITAGLSLGEYAAIVSAGAMEPEDAVRVVRQRGLLMQEAVPDGKGSMAAVLGLDGGTVLRALCGIEGVYLANYNCPGQIVITGYREAVEQAAGVLTQAGAKRVIPLTVSGPFHSPMMEPASAGLEKALEKVRLQNPAIPYVTNVTGLPVTQSSEIKPLLVRQVAGSVLWQQSVERMIKDGADTFVEIGPGRTLTGFIRKISRSVRYLNIRTLEEMKQVCEILHKEERTYDGA